MLDQFLGHRPRVTAYFAVLAVGLSLLLTGVEATRLRLVGPGSPTTFAGYAAVGLLVGLVLAFVAAYVNQSLVAGWLTGSVPAGGWYGARLLEGSVGSLETAAIATAGVGLVVGGVGYGLAAEKHRREAITPDIPAVTPRVTTASLAAASVTIGGGCIYVIAPL